MYFYGVVFISIIFGFVPLVIGRLHRSVYQDPAISVAPSVNIIHVQKNSRLVLDCPVTSSANQLNFFWYKDGVEVVQQKRVHVELNGSLIIEKVLNKRRKGRNDAGIYECLMENNYGQIIGRLVEVAIFSKLTLSVIPDQVTVPLGGVARFECRLQDPSQLRPHYIWQRSSATGLQLIKNDLSHLGVLHVYNVSKKDEGAYTCKVVHSDGMLEKSAFLRIEDSSGQFPTVPQLLNTSQHITVTEGQTALLECLVQGKTRATVTWQYSGGHVITTSDRLAISGNSYIKITNTQRQDLGTYICVVNNPGGRDINRAYTLNVLAAPRFRGEAPKKILSHILVQRARLYCNVSGNPTPSVHWYKDGLKIFPTPQSELVIHGRADEIGYYQCLAENDVGYVISTTWVTFTRKPNTPAEVKNVSGVAVSPTVIQLRWDPVLNQSQPLWYGIDYHRVSDLQCPGRCMHLLQRDRELSKGTAFNITNLTPYTLYAFSIQCYNYNGAGAMSEEIMIRTQEAVPSTSPDMQITPDTETSFRVQWSELPRSVSNGRISKHKLFYGTALKMEVTELKGNVRDYLVIGLDPDTLYKVRVLAGNSAGYPNIVDNWVTYRTPAREKDYATLTPALTFEPINSSTVLIRWSHSGPRAGRYRIMIQKQLEGGPVLEYNISADKDQFIIRGLENRTFYKVDFMVKDQSNNVVSIVTELYQSLNPEDQQEPPPPMILDPDPISSATIHVSWEKPKTSLDIEAYTVKYQQRHGEELVADPKYVESASQMVRLIGLQSYTWYVISVRSHTASDYGPFSKPVIVQTLEGIPSPPENLLAEVVSPGTVKLKWGPPRKQNGIITYYIIYYNPDKNVPDRDWLSIQQNASTTSVVVNDLGAKIYYFKLRACTKAGEGNSSDIIMINTLDCRDCPSCTSEHACVTSNPISPKMSSVFEQRLGIIIGCMVGLVCIIICVTVIIIKHRSYRRLRAAAAYGHTSSDHHVGRYLSQQTNDESLALAGRPPYLNGRLVENSDSDSKGGHYVVYRGEPDKNLILIAGAQGSQIANGRQVPAERRALLSPSSSSSHGNDTSSNPTLDTGTLESSFSTPDKVDYDITCTNRITPCDSPEEEEEENTEDFPSSKKEEPPEEENTDNNKHGDHPIVRSHSGSHDSGFEIDFCAKPCENVEKLCSNSDYNETHPHLNINC